ncbi:MAG TPA: SurA N-terminal domain-containing protein [Gallionella sp.]
MFDFVHNNKKLVRVFMALIILPFALWGVDSYTRSGNAGVAASVNGEKITQQDFENALRQQQQRLREQLGAGFDDKLFDTPEMRRAVLDNLIAQRLLLDRAKAAGLVVTDDQVAQIIGNIEAFQQDGKFDKARYREVLSRENIAPLTFEARLRNEVLGQQMQESYAQNGFASATVAENIIRLNEQKRVVRLSPVSSKQFEAKADVSEAAVKEYFEQNPGEFLVQEQARVEFVRLSVDGLLPKVNVSDDEVRDYYKTHETEFGSPEARRAAHILISTNVDAPQAALDSAKAKAEQLFAQVRRDPASFSELAIKNSQDPGSAAKGGDLGFFGRGMMVKPFEDAVFSMKKGEISEVIKSDFGFHIIKLLDVEPTKIKPLSEVREGIVFKLRQQKASDMFAELAEQFSNAAYEQSDSLKPAADLSGGKIEKSGWLTRQMAAGEPWTAEMLQAIFSDEAVKDKRNTAAIEVAPDTLVAARVIEYKPAASREFVDVRAAIREKLVHQKAAELAIQHAESLLRQLQAGNQPKMTWGSAQSITRGQHGTLDAGLVRSIFQADAVNLPQFVGAKTGQGDFVIARIDAVKEGGEIDDAKRARYIQQLRRLTGEELSRAHLADAQLQANISVQLSDVKADQP